MFRRYFCLISACAGLIFSAASAKEDTPSLKTEEQATWDGSVFRIEDAKTRVSVASVKLSVSELKPEEGNLVGEYTIHVPLMSSKDDHGKIVLPLEFSIDEMGAKGGTLRGQAISYKEGKTPNAIVCEIFPHKDQKILLEITTDDRTLEFKSRYSIVSAAGEI